MLLTPFPNKMQTGNYFTHRRYFRFQRTHQAPARAVVAPITTHSHHLNSPAVGCDGY
jgi:hypothetical protein